MSGCIVSDLDKWTSKQPISNTPSMEKRHIDLIKPTAYPIKWVKMEYLGTSEH